MISTRLVSGASSGVGRTGLPGLIRATGRGMVNLLAFVRDLARELADENAYSRHLSWHGRSHSRAEWKAFCDSRLARKYTQGKCC
jgi:hypothetical protein